MTMPTLVERVTAALEPLDIPIKDPAGIQALRGPFIHVSFAGGTKNVRKMLSVEVAVFTQWVTQIRGHAELEKLMRRILPVLDAAPGMLLDSWTGAEELSQGDDEPEVDWITATITVTEPF